MIDKIKGTEGVLDYFKIAESNNTILAIKPLMNNVPNQGVILACRLRSVMKTSTVDQSNVHTLKVEAIAKNFIKEWPMFKWHKIDATRASLVMGLNTGSYPLNYLEMKEFINGNNVLPDLFMFLSKGVSLCKNNMVVNNDEFVDLMNKLWVTEYLDKNIEEINKKIPNNVMDLFTFNDKKS